MNTRDRITTALTPGSPFNANGLIWRSVQALSQFAGCNPDETLELLAGDLADAVVIRPSNAGKGLLAALKEHIPEAANQGDGEVMNVAGGPAFNAPPEAVPEPMEEAVEMAQPPAPEAQDEMPVEPVAVGAIFGQVPGDVADEAPLGPGMDPDEPAMD